MTGYTGTLAFGSNTLFISGSATAYSGDVGTTITGTNPTIQFDYTGSASMNVFPRAVSQANSVSLRFVAGNYALSISTPSSVRDISFSGYTGVPTANSLTIYGDVLSYSPNFLASAASWTFASTSATVRTINLSGNTFDKPAIFNGVGGTWKLNAAFTQGSTRLFSHTNGTIDLNGFTLTVGISYNTTVGTKNLTFNGGTLVCPGLIATGPALDNSSGFAGFTSTAGTGTGKISLTGATAKTFAGGGSTFNCTVSNDGAGALTVTGSNTFTNIANGVQPTSFLFTAATTTTVTDWNVSGTASNLVTIGSVTAASHTLSKASGTVSSNYLSISRSTATGGAAWYAGTTSTNGGNNTGWSFTAAPVNVSVSVTGVAATGGIGTATVTVDASVDVTGVAATGGIGTATVDLISDASVSVTGVEATGGIGTVTLDIVTDTNVNVTGVEATGSIGTVTVDAVTPTVTVAFEGWDRSQGWGLGAFGTGSIDIGVATGDVGSPSVIVDVDVDTTGLSATGDVGSSSVIVDVDVDTTGLSATGDVGTVTLLLLLDVDVTGVSATGDVGTSTVTVDVDVDTTGLSATGDVGSSSVIVDVDVATTGVSATGDVGTALFQNNVTENATGISATGSVGSVTLTVDADVDTTGVSATGDVGTSTVTLDANVYPTGVSATGDVGTSTVTADADVAVTGVSATGSVGTSTATVDVVVDTTGVSATGDVGDVGTNFDLLVLLAGISATGYVGPVLVWEQIIPDPGTVWAGIDPNQTPNWSEIDPNQTPNWSEIDPNQTPNWSEIDPSQSPGWVPVAA